MGVRFELECAVRLSVAPEDGDRLVGEPEFFCGNALHDNTPGSFPAGLFPYRKLFLLLQIPDTGLPGGKDPLSYLPSEKKTELKKAG
jgi:hypothetical protein